MPCWAFRWEDRTVRHHQYDIAVSMYRGDAYLEPGPSLSDDDLPIDGEIIRFCGRLWSVGEKDCSDPPLLHEVHEMPELGLWWDVDDPDQCDDED